jgi:fructose-bisphosphate aldolase, class I
MSQAEMSTRVERGRGFIAALDQSGGSTPGALRLYGVPDDAYKNESEMFALIHEMRARIMTAPAFNGEKVICAILFEATMEGQVAGHPVPEYLWSERGVVPFLKVDKGLQPEADGVSLMKPIPDFDALLARAVKHGMFGTKMRSVINRASETGIGGVVAQQFEIAARISDYGLMPIIEPEVSIKSTERAQAETVLRAKLIEHLDKLPADRRVMLKLTIPETPNFYLPLIDHPRTLRVVALSGGYSRDEACRRLAANRDMIASFSRALAQDLRRSMDDASFDAALAASIEAIYSASTEKA